MACLLPHTVDEIHALVQKLIHEDSVRQKAMMDLAVQFDNASAAKQDLRQAYEKCNDIPQEARNLIDAFLKRESDKDYEINLAMYIYKERVGPLRRSANKLQFYLRRKMLKREWILLLIIDNEFIKKKLQPSSMERKEKDLSDDEDVFKNMNQAVNNIIANEEFKQKEVKKFIDAEKIQVYAILETHLKVKSINKACDWVFGNWRWVSNVSHSPTCCRIVIGWNSHLIDMMSNGSSGLNMEMSEFRDVINSLEIDDLYSSGFNFTWTKSLKNPLTNTLKKLDKMMINEEFIQNHGEAH
ncbi:hypothetical protein Tco_0706372, partial [Tanacetum coccineum]